MTQVNTMGTAGQLASLALPDRVKVGVLTYPVELVESIEDAWADIDLREPRIRVATSEQSELRQVNAFFHELTHAILDRTGDHVLTDDEPFVHRFSNVLAQVFVDNGWTFGGGAQVRDVGGIKFPPIDDAGDDLFNLNGEMFRKVARFPKIGEIVLVLEDQDELFAGNIVNVMELDAGTDLDVFAGGEWFCWDDKKLVVLELVEEEAHNDQTPHHTPS